MKKIMFFFFAVFALAFVSCGGASTENSANVSVANDSNTVVVDSTALDSTVVVDSVAAVKE